MKKILRSTYYTTVVVLFLIVAAAGFTQTKTFRSYLRSRVILELQSVLHGSLKMGAIEGNLATGFQVSDVSIEQEGVVVLSTERLEVRYDLLRLLVQQLSLPRVTLLRPHIHLWRNLKKEWNIDRLIVKSSEPDTTGSSWLLNLRHVELLGARLAVVDSFALSVRTQEEWKDIPPGAFDYANIALDPFTLKAAVRIRGRDIDVVMESLDFQSEHPRFALNNLSGTFSIHSEHTEVRKLSLLTPGTKLDLDVRMDSLNLLSLKTIRTLENAPLTLDLRVDKISFREFQQFLPGPVDFLSGQVAFDVKAGGTFGHMEIDKFQLKTPRTFLSVSGRIDNLHIPKDLELDLGARDNIIHPDDVAELLPGLHLPDFQNVGILSCDFQFKGRPDNFGASVDATIGAGKFAVTGNLDLRGDIMVYDGLVSTQNLNLAGLLQNPRLTSRLNTKTTISGSGTTLPSTTALVRLQVDTSSFVGLPVNNSVLVVDLADRVLRANLLLDAGQTRIDMTGTSRFYRGDSTNYSLEGKVYSINLSDILGEPQYESDLSFDIKAEGTTTAGSTSYTMADIHFLRSSYGNDSFENRNVTIHYNVQDSVTSSVDASSEALDLVVVGTFSPTDLIETFERGSAILAEALEDRFSNLDSLRGSAQPRDRAFRSRQMTSIKPVNAHFTVHVKDLRPLGAVLQKQMLGQASLEGSLRGTLNDLNFSGRTNINQFSLATSAVHLALTNGDLSFDIEHLSGIQTLEHLGSRITFSAQSVMVDSLIFSDVSFAHQLVNDSSSYSLVAMADSAVAIDVAGTSVFVPRVIELSLSRMNLGIADYTFQNPDTIRLHFGKDGIGIRNFVLKHEAEVLALEGILDPNGVSNLQFSASSFLLNNLQNFSRNKDYIEKVRDFNGVVNARGTFDGNFDVPKFDFSLTAEGVTVGSTIFGQISGRGSFSDGLSNVFLESRSKPENREIPPELFVSGTMPMKLGSVRTAQEGMNLLLQARGFRLEFLDPFISVTTDLSGSIHGDVTMKGTLTDPSYEGTLSVRDGRFFFNPLGITYLLSGNLIPQGQLITLENVTLSNIGEDNVPGLIDGLGSMKLRGDFTLEGITVRTFDVLAEGQLLVMKEGSRLPTLPLYGNVYIGTGTNPLHWSGWPEQSVVAGDLLIKNANITFPPSQAEILERSRLFTVTYINDTLRTSSPDQDVFEEETSTHGGVTLSNQPRTPSFSPEDVSAQNETSFLDNITYNLTVEAAGLTQVRFVFNQLTNEELFADLKGRLVFVKDQSTSRTTGELEVGQRSYYKYFKTLQATGKLLFTGDISNPELDIVAKYEGTYRPDTTRLNLTEEQKQELKVVVRLDISGTRQEPKVIMGLEVFDREGNKRPERAETQSDAIAFLVSGTFKDDMTQRQQGSLLTTSLLSSIGSSLLSGPLTELVRNQVGYITSVDVVYYGDGNKSFGESADIRITGEVGDAVIRLGGRVFSDPTNTNVSVQFPMSSVIGSEGLRNLILELERRVEGVESFEQRRPSNSIRLLYRIAF